MKKMLLIFAVALLCLTQCNSAQNTVRVILQTSKGDIELELFNQTPIHRDNFIKLVKESYFDSLLFHRVIKDFMIQGGDPDSRHAAPGVLLGDGGPDYTVTAEFRLPEIYHWRGVLAAAREGDDVNPQQASSASQFYIVWGKVFDNVSLDAQQKRLDERTGGRILLTPEMRQTYLTKGGTPHLDGQYTVFGQVLSGMEVVDSIQNVETDANDRPLEDVRILRAYIK